jgi:hypothetical protein
MLPAIYAWQAKAVHGDHTSAVADAEGGEGGHGVAKLDRVVHRHRR